MNLDPAFFKKFSFGKAQLDQYWAAAERDLEIAAGGDVPEIAFKFAYDALIKFAIAAVAGQGYRLRSVPGHHQKVLRALADYLGNDEVEDVADAMRQRRNRDLYDGGFPFTAADCAEYLRFVRSVHSRLAAKRK